MSDMIQTPSREEVTEHLRSYSTFAHLVLFAVLHIALTLACVALAFIGHETMVALLLWLGGTVALLAGFAMMGNNKQSV